MNAEAPFIDTNILVYLLKDDTNKAAKAEALLASGGVISVQVLNELLNVVRRKTDLDWPETRAFLSALEALFQIEALTVETHRFGRRLTERHKLSVYDALIVASASMAGCTTLYSEDMQPGVVLEGVTILNPFA